MSEKEILRTAVELAGKYLTFILGKEEYGVEILKVQEIIGMMPVTHVPRSPSFLRGIINLRGSVIPVVELRLKFGMEDVKDTEKTCIIVVNVKTESEAKKVVMGIIVDEVSEVVDVRSEQIDPPPKMGSAVDTTFILGVGKLGKKVAILLDIDKVLTRNEVVELNGVVGA